MRNIYKKIYKEIKKYDFIVIARHIGADPDALGSQFALRDLIKNKFPLKQVYAIGSPSNKFKFMGTLDKVEEIDYDNTLLIVLDTPDIRRIDGIVLDNYKNIIKIDHHPIVDVYADIEHIDDNSSSTCQLILEFALINRLKITEDIAKNVYLGIVSDTGRFMHSYTSQKTFELVNILLKKSKLDFTLLYEQLYMRPLNEVRFQGYIYENMEVTDNGLAYICSNQIDEQLFGRFLPRVHNIFSILGDRRFQSSQVQYVEGLELSSYLLLPWMNF